MAFNKVYYQGAKIFDISDTTATENDVFKDKTFYLANGEKGTGTRHDYKPELQELVMGNREGPTFEGVSSTELVIAGCNHIRQGFMQGNEYFQNVVVDDLHGAEFIMHPNCFKNSKINSFTVVNANDIGLFEGVFQNCSNLQYIQFVFSKSPDLYFYGDSQLNSTIFSGCTGLKSIYTNFNQYKEGTAYIPNVTSIPSKLFNDLTSIRDIVIADSNYKTDNSICIYPNAFAKSNTGMWDNVDFCRNTINLFAQDPDGQTFKNVRHLKLNMPVITYNDVQGGLKNALAITFGDNVNFVGAELFGGKFNTIVLTGGQQMTNIGGFDSATSTTAMSSFPNVRESSINIFDASESLVDWVGNNCFQNCRSLSYVYFGKSLASCGESSFEDCVNLTAINLSYTCEIGRYAFKNTGLQTIELGLSQYGLNIRDEAFKDCVDLTKVDIHVNGDIYIGPKAFVGCSENTAFYMHGTIDPSQGKNLPRLIVTIDDIIDDTTPFGKGTVYVPNQWLDYIIADSNWIKLYDAYIVQLL